MTDHVAHENRKQNQAREKLGVKLGSNASYVKGPRAKNDDVKAAVERIMAAQYNEHSDVMVLIPHIDGEPARLAAAREEQNALLLRALEHGKGLTNYEYLRAHALKALYLPATPLADEIAALRARVAELEAERDSRPTMEQYRARTKR